MSRRRSIQWYALFAEFFIAALAEAVVSAIGWLLRKAWRALKRRRRKHDDR